MFAPVILVAALQLLADINVSSAVGGSMECGVLRPAGLGCMGVGQASKHELASPSLPPIMGELYPVRQKEPRPCAAVIVVVVVVEYFYLSCVLIRRFF